MSSLRAFYKAIALEAKQTVSFFFIYYPESRLGRWLREKYWRALLKKLGAHCTIERGSTIGLRDLVEIGDYFTIGENTAIAVGPGKGIWIGDHVAIARHCFIRGANHRFDDLEVPMMEQGYFDSSVSFRGQEYSIVIEDDVWIGANCVILPGAHIGTGSVVGAGSVVAGRIPSYSIVTGNPGRKIGSRKSTSYAPQRNSGSLDAM